MARSTRARWALLHSLALAMRSALRPGAPSLPERLSAVPRMVRDSLSGRYAQVGKGRLLAMLGALLYVVSPVDVVPEAIFGLFGVADDAVLVTWLATALINDTGDYLQWERAVQSAPTAQPQDAPYADAWRGETVRSHVVR